MCVYLFPRQVFIWIATEGDEFKSRLDLVNADDMNGKMAAVLNHLVAVHELCKSLPGLLEGGHGGGVPLRSTAVVLLDKARSEELCVELADSLRTVAESVTELQELFAAGTGLQSVIAKATWYVSTGKFRVEFKPTASLVLQYGKEDSRTLVPEERLREQVCAAICVRSEPMRYVPGSHLPSAPWVCVCGCVCGMRDSTIPSMSCCVPLVQWSWLP